jgi:hypothetical protein
VANRGESLGASDSLGLKMAVNLCECLEDVLCDWIEIDG